MKSSSMNLPVQVLAVCYYRVSRNVQSDLRQENDVRDYCIVNGITIVETFREKISGKKRISMKDRPELARCIDYLKDNNINMLLCSELSRLGRTPEVVRIIDELTQKKICVISLKENIRTLDELLRPVADQLLMVNIINGIALKESDTLSYRIRSGKRTAVLSRGAWTGGKFLPYGYTSVKGILTIEPHEAKVARELFKKYITGWGIVRIANWLNSSGIPSKLGKEWAHTTIRKIMKHEIYYGKRNFDKTDYVIAPGLRIVSDKTFRKAGRIMAENRWKAKKFVQVKKHDFLFDKSLMKCGVCGRTYRGVPTRNVYLCSSAKYSYGCGNKCIRMSKTEQVVQVFLLENCLQLLKTVQCRIAIDELTDNEQNYLFRGELRLNIRNGKFEYAMASINKNILHQIIRQIYVKKSGDRQSLEVLLIDGSSFNLEL